LSFTYTIGSRALVARLAQPRQSRRHAQRSAGATAAPPGKSSGLITSTSSSAVEALGTLELGWDGHW
jgi:hypothetical protein